MRVQATSVMSLSLCVGAVLLTGCSAGWHRIPLAAGPLPERQQAQVWRGSRSDRLHGVVISTDSLSGVPYLRPTDCDSCRQAFPLAQVDSVRVGEPVGAFWRTYALITAAALVFLLIARPPLD